MLAAFRAARVAWLLVVPMVFGACISQAPPKDTLASLEVIAEPADTVVYINGRFAAMARHLAKQPTSLRPGVVYLTFKAPGYFPHDLRVDLPPGKTSIKIKLRPIPP